MAQLTPKDILEISEPIEAIYQRTVDDLLINIARHFEISGWERTRYWEIKKLSEMGALTKESAAIIASHTKMAPAEVEKAFIQVSEKACLDIDPQLKAAAAEGILQDPGTSPSTSPLMRQMIQGYVDQATDTLNMVNSTMLESTIRAYQQAIQTVVNEAMVQEAKEILQSKALEVAIGQETRVRAIRKAMDQMAKAGIPGFYDSRGRAWSPDGYVAMVIRTTSHNAAIKAVQNRQKEYGGGDIFQVSSHPGARPLCYPYQGKFFSWSSGPGTFTDGAGREHPYNNINDSSYGEPAGLFGINCGHHPIPMIPGFSYPQDQIEETPEENKKEYEESQKQRQYERQIRDAKRDLEVAKATGDEEAVKAAKQKVSQEQAKMRKYVDETGRVRRYDREQIGSTKPSDYGYREWRREQGSDHPLNDKPGGATGRMQSVLGEAYETHRTRNDLNATPLAEMGTLSPISVNYGKLSDKTQAAFTDTISTLAAEYDTTLQQIRVMTKEEALLAHRGAFATVSHNYTVDSSAMLINPMKCKDYDAMVDRLTELAKDGYTVKVAPDKIGDYIATHEFAHTLISLQDELNDKTNWLGANYEAVRAARKEIEPLFDAYIRDIGELTEKAKSIELRSIDALTGGDLDLAGRLGDEASKLYAEVESIKLSEYSMLNADEFMAEAFTNERIGEQSKDRAREVTAVLDKYFRR